MKIQKILLAVGLLSMVALAQDTNLQKAYFAGGCFWGVEYHLEDQKGVKSVTSGFMGGFKKNPTYKEVVYTRTGHIETVEVIYDPKVISFEKLTKHFFEIHDFTQVGGQGPDIGERYESYIFYNDKSEQKIAQKLIDILTKKDYKVATKLQKSSKFYPADRYHQDYYVKHNKAPYCHAYRKVF